MSLAEFYAELAFDPDGNSIYTVALKDPIGAYWASSVKDEALALVDELFPNRAQFDNEVDAFRHAYFSCRLAQEIGAERAKKFTDAYELHVVNSWGSRCMDLWNNREGRRIYADSPKSGKREFAKNEVIKAVKTKRLALSPFDIWREE